MSGNSVMLTENNDNIHVQPIIFGIHDVFVEQIVDQNLSAGAISKPLQTVPAGFIYVYTQFSMRYVGTAPARLVCSIIDTFTTYELFAQTPPVTNIVYDRNPNWALKAGQHLQVDILNATASNDIFIYAMGYTMKLQVS